MGDLAVVGTDVRRDDGADKSTGAAQYATDYYPEDCLHLKILHGARAHARILSIDTRPAEEMEGVELVVTGRDYPEAYWGFYLHDQTIFAVDKVHYVGEPVAALAGRDEELLKEAADAVRVDYEELPPVFDAIEAMRPDAPLIHEGLETYKRDARNYFPVPGTNICHHFKLRKGNTEAAFREADFVFEDAYRIPMVQHCPMEPHACVALYDANRTLNLWTSTQGPYLTRTQVAGALGLSPEKVRVVVPYCGGGFGAKISACAEILCAAAALKLPNRPVRLVFDREEEFGATFVRQELFAEYKTGVRKDGTLVARQAKLVWDTGAFGDYEVAVSRAAGQNAPGPYRIPHLRVDSYCVYTNKPKAGAFRGFGVSEVCFCYEQQMDRIARELGLDPLELRLRNVLKDGDAASTGQVLAGVGLRECLERVREALGPLESPSPAVSPTKRRGRGVACMMKSSVAHLSADAEVRVHPNGSVLLKTSAVEHGQGSHTVLRQIAAEELGWDVSAVGVAAVDTAESPLSSSTSASKTTYFDGNAVRRAAQDVRRQLLDRASQRLEADPEDLAMERGNIFLRGVPERGIGIPALMEEGGVIVGSGRHTIEDATPLDPETGQGRRPASFMMYASQGVEVEVDLETGQLEVLRIVAAHDVGRAIHPKGCEGQIEGALAQGLGTSLFEELQCENGVLVNANMLDYKIPCAEDVPPMRAMLVEAPIPDGPWGAKGVGEPGLVPTAAAVGNALFSATGHQIKTLPFTSERVLATVGRGKD